MHRCMHTYTYGRPRAGLPINAALFTSSISFFFSFSLQAIMSQTQAGIHDPSSYETCSVRICYCCEGHHEGQKTASLEWGGAL
jgi:hypothetical protein